ncbi:MAG: thioredoxin family protein [bacterium]|nr:thioredoxin family protein [bacterium]MDI1336791.1 thioredoxin family protein [Lacunisphaera sp.]
MKFLPALALLTAVATLHAEPEYPKMGPDLYDTVADGKAQIAAALSTAKADHKRVLVKLGANWCIWCRRLSHTFETDAAVAKVLQANFVLVLVDVNHREGKQRNDVVNTRYGNPMAQGLPVLVVLDEDGHQLTTQETGALEDGKAAHDPAKVIAFLQRWAPR